MSITSKNRRALQFSTILSCIDILVQSHLHGAMAAIVIVALLVFYRRLLSYLERTHRLGHQLRSGGGSSSISYFCRRRRLHLHTTYIFIAAFRMV